MSPEQKLSTAHQEILDCLRRLFKDSSARCLAPVLLLLFLSGCLGEEPPTATPTRTIDRTPVPTFTSTTTPAPASTELPTVILPTVTDTPPITSPAVETPTPESSPSSEAEPFQQFAEIPLYLDKPEEVPLDGYDKVAYYLFADPGSEDTIGLEQYMRIEPGKTTVTLTFFSPSTRFESPVCIITVEDDGYIDVNSSSHTFNFNHSGHQLIVGCTAADTAENTITIKINGTTLWNFGTMRFIEPSQQAA